MPETKRVWWIGGPNDGEMFRVPYAQKTVEVDGRELFITCRKNRYYVIWPTDG
jgi:hypothetical protein